MSRVIHFDLPANDPQRAMDFSKQVFQWKFEKWEGPMDYWLISNGGEDEPGIDGGLTPGGNPDAGTEITIGVSDVVAASAGIELHGGKILRPRSAIPGVGWIATCEDPEGNIFSIMQEDTSAA